MLAARFLIALACVVLVKAYPTYRAEIPNGDKVPNPCAAGEKWQGVGHLVPEGSGARNQFGIDFSKNGHQWLRVCNLDSDGDGKTNGDELGDPGCVWTKGNTPNRTTGLSHPGFCDPIGSTTCSKSQHQLSCEKLTFSCAATEEPGVISRQLKFPRTQVPNKVTNYFCMTFDLDQSQDYHIIAGKAELNNTFVMHHMLLYGCKDDADALPTPKSCGMSTAKCQDIIGAWTVGITGSCHYEKAGIRIGKSGYKRVLLEFHWNNPERRSDYFDESGMTIYYTPKLRQYDAGMFTTGELLLVIPPRQKRVVFESTCPSECTQRMLSDSIYFTTGFNHMHYRGYTQTVEKTSNGNTTYLTNDQHYSYDSPKSYTYDPPIEIKPGDSLKTTCVFQSLKDNKTVYYGPSTDDEMCFGFFLYYPKQVASENTCVSSGSFQNCKLINGYMYGDCNINTFFRKRSSDTTMLMEKVTQKCLPTGHPLCSKECPSAIDEAKRHPCLSASNMKWALRFMSSIPDELSQNFVKAMKSCPSWPTSASLTTASSFFLLNLSAVMVYLLV